jgi:hypothetical protein
VDASRDVGGTAENRSAVIGRLRLAAKIVILYVAVPLAVYGLLRHYGVSAVAALLLSGVFPAAGVTIGVIRDHRIDLIGALVLVGIVIGTVFGLISHSARPVLLEGSVPTVVFGVTCLGSLWTRRPLMYGLALEFTGPETAKGREMIGLWQYDGFRHVFRVISAVWGVAFLLEAALRVVIVYNTSTGTALALSNVTPFIWLGVLSAWTVGYGTYRKKKGEQQAAAGVTIGVTRVTGDAETPRTSRAIS